MSGPDSTTGPVPGGGDPPRVLAHPPFPTLYAASGAATATIAFIFTAFLARSGAWMPAAMALGFAGALAFFTFHTTRLDWVAASSEGVERGVGRRRNILVPWADIAGLGITPDATRLRIFLVGGRILGIPVTWVGAEAFGASVQQRRPAPGARIDRDHLDAHPQGGNPA